MPIPKNLPPEGQYYLIVTKDRGKTVVVDLGTTDPAAAQAAVGLALVGDKSKWSAKMVRGKPRLDTHGAGGLLTGKESVSRARLFRYVGDANVDELKVNVVTTAAEMATGVYEDRERTEMERLQKKYAGKKKVAKKATKKTAKTKTRRRTVKKRGAKR